jgi:hypothetical protein
MLVRQVEPGCGGYGGFFNSNLRRYPTTPTFKALFEVVMRRELVPSDVETLRLVEKYKVAKPKGGDNECIG